MEVDTFKTKAYLPSLKKFILLNELTNKQYINILKYVQNDDTVNLNKYFNHLIETMSDNTISISKMNRIDRFCLLLHIRIVGIGPELTLNLNCKQTGKEYTGRIDLNDILQSLTDLPVRMEKRIQVTDGVTVKLSIPKQLHNENLGMLEMISQCIDYINVNGTILTHQETTNHYRIQVLENLPGSCMSAIHDFIQTAQKPFEDFVVLEDNNPHVESLTKSHRLSLFDNSIFEFLKLCYTDNLSNFYQLIYNLSSINFSPEYIMNISPAESIIYIQFKKQEIEAEKQQHEKDNNNQTIPGLNPSNFNM